MVLSENQVKQKFESTRAALLPAAKKSATLSLRAYRQTIGDKSHGTESSSAAKVQPQSSEAMGKAGDSKEGRGQSEHAKDDSDDEARAEVARREASSAVSLAVTAEPGPLSKSASAKAAAAGSGGVSGAGAGAKRKAHGPADGARGNKKQRNILSGQALEKAVAEVQGHLVLAETFIRSAVNCCSFETLKGLETDARDLATKLKNKSDVFLDADDSQRSEKCTLAEELCVGIRDLIKAGKHTTTNFQQRHCRT